MVSNEFLLTSLVVILVPGTGVIYTISNGISLGKRASIAAAVGCTLGILPHMTACLLGLSALLHASARAFQILKTVGAVYLLYLAWSMWRDTGTLTIDGARPKTETFHIALRGLLINILNPKLTLFFFAFLPLFLAPDAVSPNRQMLLLGIVFMGMTLLVFIGYGILAGSVGGWVSKSPKALGRIRKSFAVILAAMAAKLALSEK